MSLPLKGSLSPKSLECSFLKVALKSNRSQSINVPIWASIRDIFSNRSIIAAACDCSSGLEERWKAALEADQPDIKRPHVHDNGVRCHSPVSKAKLMQLLDAKCDTLQDTLKLLGVALGIEIFPQGHFIVLHEKTNMINSNENLL